MLLHKAIQLPDRLAHVLQRQDTHAHHVSRKSHSIFGDGIINDLADPRLSPWEPRAEAAAAATIPRSRRSAPRPPDKRRSGSIKLGRNRVDRPLSCTMDSRSWSSFSIRQPYSWDRA